MGCTLAQPGEYGRTVRVRRRCGLFLSNYFDHLLCISCVKVLNVLLYFADVFFCFAHRRRAKYCDYHRPVCMTVCTSVRSHKKSRVQTSRNFLYVLNVAAVRSSSDDNAIRYVLPVLWMTSCLPIIGQRRRQQSVYSVTHRGQTGGGLMSSLYLNVFTSVIVAVISKMLIAWK